ncbi:MAG: hypothetical protein ACOVOV_03635 [Dolichospermum sp.]
MNPKITRAPGLPKNESQTQPLKIRPVGETKSQQLWQHTPYHPLDFHQVFFAVILIVYILGHF